MIKNLRFAAKVVSSIIEKIKKEIKPGLSGKDLEKIAILIMKEKKVKSSSLGYGGFPASICVSINDELTHGIPSNKAFIPGDLVSVDVACNYKGFHADSASTFLVEDRDRSNELQHKNKELLLNVTKSALMISIDNIVPRKTKTSDLGAFIQSYVESKGLFVIKEYGGHGIGRMLHMDPFVPNCKTSLKGETLMPGMVICIEPLVQLGNGKIKTSSNGKTVVSSDGFLNAHFEHTVLIRDRDVEILT